MAKFKKKKKAPPVDPPQDPPADPPAGKSKKANDDDLLSSVVNRQKANKKRPVGRPPKNKDGKPGEKEEKEKKKVLSDEEKKELVDIAAKASADAQIGLMSALFGRTFSSGYYGKDDDEILGVGFKYWYRVRGVPFPAWAVFILCQLAYFGVRFGDPANRKAVKDSFSKFKGKIVDEKAGPPPRQPERGQAQTAPAIASASTPKKEEPEVIEEVKPPKPGDGLRQPIGGDGEDGFIKGA